MNLAFCFSLTATDTQLNDALTAMATAQKALERKVFYLPYVYEDTIFYMAVSEETDTYGKWYDANFKRIVSDLTILKLDAQAKEADIAKLDLSEYVLWNSDVISPYINILDELYPELKNEKIIGAVWNEFDTGLFTEIMGSHHVAALNNLIAINTANELGVNTEAAEGLLAREDVVTLAEAEAAIAALEKSVTDALKAKEDAAAAANTNMTADQRTLLTTAVNAAKAIKNYATDENLAGLRAAAVDAEALLANAQATKTEADAKLAALNSALKAAGGTEVTVANTIVIQIPTGSEHFEIVNTVEYPGVSLQVKPGVTGAADIGVIAVTESGVILNLTKKVTVYMPADEAKIQQVQADGKHGDLVKLQLALSGDDSQKKLTTALFYTDPTKTTEAYGTFVEGIFQANFGETIKSVTWSSGNPEIVSISGMTSSECYARAVGAGTTVINVSVETHQGNVYVAQITVTVG